MVSILFDNSKTHVIVLGMTNAQLTTLQNFSPCSSPELAVDLGGLISLETPCTENGDAEYDVTDLVSLVPFSSVSVGALDSEGNVTSTHSGMSLMVPEGTFTIQLTFGQCNVFVSEITVTCSAPVAPVAAPVASTPSASNTPSKKASSASILAVGSVALVAATLLI
jgi:hypothetical protein